MASWDMTQTTKAQNLETKQLLVENIEWLSSL
jgi:hypothetical protein